MFNVKEEKITPGKECLTPNGKYSLGKRYQVHPPAKETHRGRRLCLHHNSMEFLRAQQLGRRRGSLKNAASGIWWGRKRELEIKRNENWQSEDTTPFSTINETTSWADEVTPKWINVTHNHRPLISVCWQFCWSRERNYLKMKRKWYTVHADRLWEGTVHCLCRWTIRGNSALSVQTDYRRRQKPSGTGL